MKTRATFRAILFMLFFTLFFTCASVANTTVKVMTYNVDEGTDFAAIIAVLTNPNATAADFQTAVEATAAEVQNSNIPLRMQLIAQEITAAQPDLVGLQEAAVWMFDHQRLDLLQMILHQLKLRGQHYKAVITVPEFQIDITQLGVSFTDRDVILARTDEPALKIVDAQQGHYIVQVPLPAFPPYLPNPTSITRGWAYVDVLLNETPFRFITTHLEDGTVSSAFAQVQYFQEFQLVYSPALSLLPVIIGGDFNTVANDPSSSTYGTYQFMLTNGFADAWSTANPGLPGLTCCQDNLTSGDASALTQRLDQVFVRNHVSVIGAQLVGDHVDVSPDGNSWPSDHAGVASELRVSSVP